ncbi:uncharacterized protein N7483_002241 [Penicillium malachiteum]|uniref:uncharacterized protein n=1 Tax=Penicillium malachiteum TaxID=1324776 RepID=UPI0025490574|nr:uncharacterized protein N7483_002241 [Penicillium malachiteum]KAJ5737116.1 hypothetical protein N7483_002241 [Penicillium malachiteum]
MPQTPRKHVELDAYTHTQICTLKHTGLTYKQLQLHFPNIPFDTLKSTVQRAKNRVKNETSPRSGRPKNITDMDKAVLFAEIDRNPRLKIVDLLAKLEAECCAKTLMNCLRECSMRKWRVLKRPELTGSHATQRLA